MSPAGCESGLEIFDLPQFRLRELAPLLDEEVQTWKQWLLWDYSNSSKLVGQFIDSHALSGTVLCNRQIPVGYSYYIAEEHKALVGCLFLSEPYRGDSYYSQLLQATLASIRQRQSIQRIEAQFMLHPFDAAALPVASNAQVYERLFMRVALPHRGGLGWSAPLQHSVRVEPWHERFQDRAAYLIEEAYRDHLDSQINDQYQTADGARRFLYNIIQYPGCGSFANDASFVAVENGTGRLLGGCLTSIVDAGVGHITQVCTVPEVRGMGLGSFLIERSLDQLWQRGCSECTLTVTARNAGAIRLYVQLGFTVLRRFPAYVWTEL